MPVPVQGLAAPGCVVTQRVVPDAPATGGRRAGDVVERTGRVQAGAARARHGDDVPAVAVPVQSLVQIVSDLPVLTYGPAVAGGHAANGVEVVEGALAMPAGARHGEIAPRPAVPVQHPVGRAAPVVPVADRPAISLARAVDAFEI